MALSLIMCIGFVQGTVFNSISSNGKKKKKKKNQKKKNNLSFHKWNDFNLIPLGDMCIKIAYS